MFHWVMGLMPTEKLANGRQLNDIHKVNGYLTG